MTPSVSPGVAHRHAILHAQPLISATVEHVAGQSERNARGLYQPVGGGHLVIEEALAEPHLIYIREEIGILISRAFGESGIWSGGR